MATRTRDPRTGLYWFTDSPQEGEPACQCSFCLKVIPEETDDGDGYIAIRMWKSGDPCLEARFHDDCFNILLARGVLKLMPHESHSASSS